MLSPNDPSQSDMLVMPEAAPTSQVVVPVGGSSVGVLLEEEGVVAGAEGRAPATTLPGPPACSPRQTGQSQHDSTDANTTKTRLPVATGLASVSDLGSKILKLSIDG